MSLHDRLRALIDAADPDGTVTVRWLAALLSAEDIPTAPAAAGEPLTMRVDLTVHDVATMFGRGESTVRSWIAADRFPNAYRLHGREWRIPRDDIANMQRQAASARTITSADGSAALESESDDLSSWRSSAAKRERSPHTTKRADLKVQ